MDELNDSQSSTAAEDDTTSEPEEEGVHQALLRITELVTEQVGHDFSRYKPSTLQRRVRRRMQMLGLDEFRDYIQHLQDSDEEPHLLIDELLIGVTSFFRDHQAFEALAQQVLPEIFESRSAGEPVRIWVPGCSTGQEAYSIAMLCAEYLDEHSQSNPVQLFASDIDQRALADARRGLYPRSITDEISDCRLTRFFTETNDGFQVSERLRDMCLFSRHDLSRDPAFSSLDLISCRNLLIYLGTDLQQEVLDKFCFALRPGGFLFLGPSETVRSHGEMLREFDSNHRIFQCDKNTSGHLSRTTGQISAMSNQFLAELPGAGEDIFSRTRRLILDRYSPRWVVIDRERRVVCNSGNTGRYLTLSQGNFENDLLKMARSELRVGLRSALRNVLDQDQKVVHRDLSVETNEGIQPVRITVEPFPPAESTRDLFLVVFEELGEPLSASDSRKDTDDTDEVIAHLEQELSRAHRDLDETVRELEFSNEELRSSNEELLSMNEELQSANEEMETAKEEVQAANQELADTNADLENLLESTRIATLFLDEKLRVQRMTPAVRQLYNVKPGDVGRPITDVTHRAEAMPPLPDIQQVYKAGEPLEDQLRTEDGRWFLRRVLPYRDSDDNPRGLVVTFIDNTDRYQARQRANRLAAIVDSSADAIIGKDLDGIITSWNRAAEQMYGFTADEMLGSHISRLFPENRSDEFREIMEQLRAGKRIESFETRRQRKDGTIIDVSLTISPVRDGNDELIGASAVARDITDRLERQRMLQTRNRALQNLNRMNRALASSLEPDELLQQLTDYATELVGAEFGAFFYHHQPEQSFQLRAISGGDDRKWSDLPIPSTVLGPLFNTETAQRLEDITLDERFDPAIRDNDLFQSQPPLRSCLTAPVVSREGELYGGLLFGHSDAGRFDEEHQQLLSGLAAQASIAWGNAQLYEQLNDQLQERKAAEQQLEAAIAEAKAANEAKSEFLANMSHEIRTPMSAILGYADVLMNHLENPDNRECVETIRRNGNYLLELIDDILDLSKIEAGKLEIDPRPVAPAQIAASVVSLMSIRARDKSLNLEIDFASRIPETIATDPVRLRQILVNLVGNAIKFTEDGRVTLGVEITDDEQPHLLFSVADTGVGMTEEEQEELFEPFARGDNVSWNTEHSGTGLGLSICRRLVKMLGGEIWIDSEPNVGTTVTFTIDPGPLDDVDFIEPNAVIERPRQPISVASLQLDCTVLVVDDRREIRMLAAHYLEEAGARVETVSDGQQAVDAVEQAVRESRPFGAIIMDMHMPGMDGYQATKKLRRLGYDTPIIALTAAAMESDRRRCLDAGCNDYVAKPARADELTKLVANHVHAPASTPEASPSSPDNESDDDNRADPAPADKPADGNDNADHQTRQVLLVEDSPDARQSLAQLMEVAGDFDVEPAANGAEALQAAEDADFDIVLLDLGLPDMNGYEVLEELQQLDELTDTRFIALTGWGTPEQIERSRRVGFDDHIVKPISLDELQQL